MQGRHNIRREETLQAEVSRSNIMVRNFRGLRIVLLTVSVSLAAASGVRAQGEYLAKGTSGWEIFGGYTSGWGLESGSVTAGYSGDGVVEAVASFSHLSFINPYTFEHYVRSKRVTGNAFSLMLSAYLAKQMSGEFPLSICFSGGCYMGSFTSPGSEFSLPMAMANGYMSYGITIYRDFHLAHRFHVQPSVGYFYSDGFGAVAEKYTRPEVGNDYVRSFIAGVSLAFETTGTETLVFKPVLRTFRGVTLFSIEAGVVVGIGSRKGKTE